MKKVESLIVKYLGYKDPETDEEVMFEVLGLKTAIAAAQQKVAVLEQGLHLKKLIDDATVEEKNEKTVDPPSTASENKQEG